MDPKEYLTNKNFCPIPWTGFMYNSNGDVMNCIRSQRSIGNLNDNSIHDILSLNTQTKQNMLDNKPGLGCNGCYSLEHNKKSFDIISDRVFYLKELKDVNRTLYDNVDNFDLHKIDVRWSNVCNFGCIYCGPEYSSRIATELNIEILHPATERVQEMKTYIFENAHKLKHVYMAGGEPLLMKENLELLELLKQVNPDVNLRINTNLSKVDTRVFQTVCEFKNVHWTVSVETVSAEYEYIRYGSSWQDFANNLLTIQRLGHKISFNMLYFILNYKSIFECIRFLQKNGFHNNSFVIGPLLNPISLDVRNLPEHIIFDLTKHIQIMIDSHPGFLLEDGLKNLLSHFKKPFDKNLKSTFETLKAIDKRRGLNSELIFSEVYSIA